MLVIICKKTTVSAYSGWLITTITHHAWHSKQMLCNKEQICPNINKNKNDVMNSFSGELQDGRHLVGWCGILRHFHRPWIGWKWPHYRSFCEIFTISKSTGISYPEVKLKICHIMASIYHLCFEIVALPFLTFWVAVFWYHWTWFISEMREHGRLATIYAVCIKYLHMDW